jgi:FlaA1/EpsC-like NDP-sugar epimerase
MLLSAKAHQMIDLIRQSLSRLSRLQKQCIQALVDVALLFTTVYLAYLLRFGPGYRPTEAQLAFMALAPLVALPFFVRLGLYRAILRYLPDKAGWTIVQAMVLATLAWIALAFLSEMTGGEGVPRSIAVIYWAVGTLAIGASRFAARRFFAVPNGAAASSRRVLIFGAGQSGIQLATALRASGDTSVVGFLDDDPHLIGQDVAGRRVFARADLSGLIESLGVTDVILSMPSASANKRLELSGWLSDFPVRLSVMPAISDLAAGRYSISQLKTIDIVDLLGRSSIAPDANLITKAVAGKSVLITGAGGSIGSELCRLVARSGPRRMVLFEVSEFALYEIHRALRAIAPDLELVPVLGSVADACRVDAVFADGPIDVVFHAAAYKHVPLVEDNVVEGVRNNVMGTRALADAAFRAGAGTFVLISTDKAVHPSSVMGATKRLSELIVSDYARKAAAGNTGQRFLSVRFGNVLGSTGSVVPLFKEQISQGGPVTITDNRMTRYFMAISEAAELIVQAAALAEGGDVFLLDMGDPILIRTLAENMVRLAGLSVRDTAHPDGDIEIREIGIRPGEKLFETLFYDPASATPSAHPKIYFARTQGQDAAALADSLADLEVLIAANQGHLVREHVFAALRPHKNVERLRQAAGSA